MSAPTQAPLRRAPGLAAPAPRRDESPPPPAPADRVGRWATAASLLGALGVAGVAVATFVLAAAGAARPRWFFVPAARGGFPDWLSGPLADLGLVLEPSEGCLFLLGMSACYLVALATARWLSPAVAIAGIVAAHVVLALGPPLFSADVFGYLSYARLDLLHGVDPYASGGAATGDPVSPFVLWHDMPSPYGALFTALSWGSVPLGVPAGLWAFKVLTAAASLGAVALVWRLAERMGRPPVFAAAFVGLNPLLLAYGVGGAHNDLLLMPLVVAGLWLAVVGRERGGVLAMAAATAIKLPAALPFAFLVAGARDRRRVLATAAATVAGLALAGLLVFGPEAYGFLGHLREQGERVARESVLSRGAELVGLGEVSSALRLAATLVLVAVVGALLVRVARGADWIPAAGWATVALLVTTAWLLPWYVAWLLPLAALARDPRLHLAALGVCAFIVYTRVDPYLLQ